MNMKTEKAKSAIMDRLAGLIPQKQKCSCCAEFERISQEDVRLKKEFGEKAVDFAEGNITQEDFLKAKNKIKLFDRTKKRADGLRAFITSALQADYADEELLRIFKEYMQINLN